KDPPRLHRARQRASVGDRLREGAVAQPGQEPLAGAARRFPVRDRAPPDPGHHRRGARALHLLDLLMTELYACPACQGPLLPTLRCAACAVSYRVVDGIPDRRVRAADDRTETVRDFYTVAPSPGYPPRLSLSMLRARAARSDFARLLDQAIPPDARVLE